MKPRCSLSGRSKRSYASEPAALRAATDFAARHGTQYRAYRCECGRYHLTTLNDEALRALARAL